MPPRTALATSLRSWRCPACTLRTFTTTQHRSQFGPEHPRYIDVPEPPQQSLPYLPFIKGRLPVPRNIFPGKDGLEKASDEKIALSTPEPTKRRTRPEPGSHLAWKQNQSASRRRNLREGLKALESRKIRDQRRLSQRRTADRSEQEYLRALPERESDRLTTPSTNLNLPSLLKGPLPDPNRAARLAAKRRNYHLHTSAARAERLDNLHTLYMNARNFIVNTEQLDQAIEEEFEDGERKFADRQGTFAQGSGELSMWRFGPPDTVQDMLRRASGKGERGAMARSSAEVGEKRVTRIGEKLLGGEDGWAGAWVDCLSLCVAFYASERWERFTLMALPRLLSALHLTLHFED